MVLHDAKAALFQLYRAVGAGIYFTDAGSKLSSLGEKNYVELDQYAFVFRASQWPSA